MKSKPVSVFHFNPTCELAVANGSPYYTAPALLRRFEEELAPVMLFLSNNNDLIIKEIPVSDRFTEQLWEYAFPCPVFLQKQDIPAELEKRDCNIIRINPWGMSPAESYYFQFLNRYAATDWLPDMKKLYERETSVRFLKQIIRRYRNDLFPKPEELPLIVKSVAEIEHCLQKWDMLVIKAPLSSSGRGLQVIRKKSLSVSNKQWIETNLKQQHYLVAEKWYNKILDISFQFKIGKEKQVDYLGTSYFITNTNGQYQGHHLHFAAGEQLRVPMALLDETAECLQNELCQSLYAETYTGYLGIDAMLYRDENELKIHPCLEINARSTMGTVSKSIEKYIHPESRGYFRTWYRPGLSFHEFAPEQAKKKIRR